MAAITHWTCRDGRVLAIKDMETSHIRNCISMMRRKGIRSRAEARALAPGLPPNFQGEMAQMQAEREWLDAWDQYFAIRWTSAIDALEAELTKRSNQS